MNQPNKAARYVVHGLVIVYTIACLWLFFHQSLADLSLKSEIPYQSDLPLHISMILEDGWYYSFTAYIYKLLSMLFQGSTIGICIFLSLVEAATVYATENLVCYLGRYQKNWFTLLLALGLNFVMPCYIRAVGEFRYVSYQSGNIWHNSTYICMRLAALITLLYYFRLENKYRDGLTGKEWCCFAILNMICTGIKPSFLLAFSPIMGVWLLADLFRRVPLRRILLFGSALLPSGLVLLWQNTVLFGEETGNGIGFRPWYSFSLHSQIPKLAVLCSALFCILVLCVRIGDLTRERETLFLVVMTVLGFLEALCLVESGSRSVDGNFLWGYSFCLFTLFVLCAVKWVQMDIKRLGARVIRASLGLVFGWHLYCGLYFFVKLVSGAGYWMR